ncbi:multidrug efflux pump subunit AcrA (membrane-fusion protein) [Bradyrhizobium huanghuaihaiense]
MKGNLALFGRIALTVLAVIAALVVGRELWVYYMESPWTRDGRVRADVVQVAPDVSGFVTEVLVKDNQKVRRGDVCSGSTASALRWRCGRPMRRWPVIRPRSTRPMPI